jgi:hypothetical protein
MITHADATRLIALLRHPDPDVRDRARGALVQFIEQYQREDWTRCIMWLCEVYMEVWYETRKV